MTSEHSSRWRTIGAAVALVVVGLCLRSPLTSLAAVLPDIQADHHLTPTTAGLLTSLPVLCFGIGAAVISGAARKFGLNTVMTASLILLTGFLALRPFGGPGWLLLATGGIGIAITAGNVLLPVIVRRDFSAQQGRMMAVSTSSIIGGAALAAALTVPLWAWLGWRLALASWAVLAALAALLFLIFTGADEPEPPRNSASAGVWKLPGAWTLAVFFGLNSGMTYATTHWLPTFLPDVAGASESEAGLAAAAFQFFGLAGALVVPIIFTKAYNRQAIATLLACTWPIYTLGLLLAPSLYLVWIVIGAVAQGGVYAMFLTLCILRAADLGTVRDLSGMTQTVGYFISALTPVAIGALFEATGSWTASFAVMVVMSIVLVAITPTVSSRKKLEPSPA